MKKIFESSEAPAPIGPYNQAVGYKGTLYVSGQIPLTPEGTLHTGSIEEQTHKVMENLGHILKASGSGFDRVLKCSIFLSDMSTFAQVNEVYGSYFKEDPPARETVEVSGLPKGVDVEISCVAAID